MITLKMEKQCGCFKKSDLEAQQQFTTKEEAMEKAEDMCKHMNDKFCQKHQFSFEETENEIIIKVEMN